MYRETYAGITYKHKAIMDDFFVYEAFHMERQIKAWSKEKKLALIKKNWNRLSQLGKKNFKSIT